MYENLKKEADNKKMVKTGNTRSRVAQYLSVGVKQVQDVWTHYRNTGEVREVAAAGNLTVHPEAIHGQIHSIVESIRDFIAERAITGRTTVAKHIRDFLIQNGTINEEVKQLTVQRNLRRHGFHPCKCIGRRTNLAEKLTLVKMRRTYLQKLHQNQQMPEGQRLQEVYIDESYVHHHHRHSISYALESSTSPTPVDEHRLCRISSGKGRRYCFVAAGTEDGWVHDSVVIFTAQSSHGDYHGNFNGAMFLKWFSEKLLPNLHRPSLIILDNASYHKSLPADTPKPWKLKRGEAAQYLRDQHHDVAFNPEMLSRIELIAMVSKHIKATVKPTIVQAAEQRGHQVLWTPPHHSDLQPCELAWAYAKNYVASQYSNDTTFAMVYERIEHGLAQCNGAFWKKIIEHCNQEGRTMLKRDNALYDNDENNAATIILGVGGEGENQHGTTSDDDEEEEEEEEDNNNDDDEHGCYMREAENKEAQT